MALIANIQPVQLMNETATQLACEVSFYDLREHTLILYWYLLNDREQCIFNANWTVSSDIISLWNSDDSVIIQGLADKMGYTITSIAN